jgi:hypothetical protein
MHEMITSIHTKIYILHGKQIMLDFDLSEHYPVEIKRFPDDFMFQLNEEEYESLRSQFSTLETG